MKKILGLFLFAITFSACIDDRVDEENTAAGSDEEPTIIKVQESTVDTLCFLRTEGINNVDSFFIKLIVKGDTVLRGDMRFLPKEKDSRIGVFLPGAIKGDTTNLDWNCIQEGRKFSVPVSFLLRNGNIQQKAWAYDKNGEEYLPDTAAYDITYNPIDCSLFPVKVY